MKVFDLKSVNFPKLKLAERNAKQYVDYWIPFKPKREPEPEKSEWHKQQVAELKQRLGIN